jgi:hypothetical protein
MGQLKVTVNTGVILPKKRFGEKGFVKKNAGPRDDRGPASGIKQLSPTP